MPCKSPYSPAVDSTTPPPKGWIPEMGYGHKSTVKRHDHVVLRKSSSTAAAVSAGASWGRSWPMTGISRR
jgi:hypothetical protein